jgi:hypothetical protein
VLQRASRGHPVLRSCNQHVGPERDEYGRGSLRAAGYFMGDTMYVPPSESNPKDFYEDRQITSINDALSARAFPGTTLPAGHDWLTSVPVGPSIPAPRDSFPFVWLCRPQDAGWPLEK